MPLSKTIRTRPEPIQALNEAFEQWLDNPTDDAIRSTYRGAFKDFLDYILDQVTRITAQNEIEIRRIMAEQVAANKKRIEVLEDRNTDIQYSLNLLHELFDYIDIYIAVVVNEVLQAKDGQGNEMAQESTQDDVLLDEGSAV